MRIRSTKPEFWRSERIASVDWDARLVLKGLESYVDDNGVGKDDLPLIVADIFPRDLSRNPTGTLQKVSEAMTHLSEAGLLWRYDVEGTHYLYVSFWESIQRIDKPTKGRYPRPDGTLHYRQSEIREPSGNPPVILPEDSRQEQGNRGSDEQGNSSSSSEIADAIRPDDERPEIDQILDYLDERIEANGAKKPSRGKKARDSVRLMLDRDGRTVEGIHAAIEFATGDEFWRSNILSAPKLRQQYDTLSLQAQRTHWRPTDRHQRDADFWENEMAAARAMDESAMREIES